MAATNPALPPEDVEGGLQEYPPPHNRYNIQQSQPSAYDGVSFSKKFESTETILASSKPSNGDSSDSLKTRDKWGKDIEGLLSCIAMSVGLGNVWLFPYTALKNGGGAFVIPYLIVLLLVGRPVYYLEMLIPQFSSRGAIKVYDAAPAMRGIGYGQTYAVTILMTFYASVVAITMRFLVASFGDPLPWSECQDSWNATCIDSGVKAKIVNTSNTAANVSSAQLYYEKEVLHKAANLNDGIGTPYLKLVLCLLVPWICICLILIKGIKSSGKASYFLAIFPYVIMLILLIRSSTLEGAVQGVVYFLKPNFEKMREVKVWYAAVTQVFFSLSVCFGPVMFYSSYNRFSNNVHRDVTIVTILDTCTSMLSGGIVFGVLGHLAHITGVDVENVVGTSSGLAFITYPGAIAKFELWPQFFAVVFFLMLFVLGIGTNVGMATSIMALVRDQFPKLKPSLIAVAISIFGFGIGIIYTTPGGSLLTEFLEFYGTSFVVLVLAVFEMITFCWIYGVGRICRDLEFMLGIKTGLFWRICWGFVTPIMLIAILIFHIVTLELPNTKGVPNFSNGMNAFGWCLFAAGVLQLPAWAMYAMMKRKGLDWKDRIVNCFKPLQNWGPEDPELNAKYQEMVNEYEQMLPADRNLLQRIRDNILH